MNNEFRNKMFRGAKIEDTIQWLEELEKENGETVVSLIKSKMMYDFNYKNENKDIFDLHKMDEDYYLKLDNTRISDKDELVLYMYIEQRKSINEIATEIGVTPLRIQQVFNKAIAKMYKNLKV